MGKISVFEENLNFEQESDFGYKKKNFSSEIVDPVRIIKCGQNFVI